MADSHPLVESWQINNRINQYLLEAIDDAHLGDTPVPKGRSVEMQFAHIHNVRLLWLKAGMKTVPSTVLKIESTDRITKKLLTQSLHTSADAITEMVARALNTDQRIKGFKPHVTAFVAYMMAHEGHHRGQIVMTLKQCGHPIPKSISYGMWEFGTR